MYEISIAILQNYKYSPAIEIYFIFQYSKAMRTKNLNDLHASKNIALFPKPHTDQGIMPIK